MTNQAEANMEKQFVIYSISRKLIETYCNRTLAESLTDEELEQIAERMSEKYFPERFYDDLQDVLREWF